MLKFIILAIIIVLLFHCITSQKHSNNEEPQKFNFLKKKPQITHQNTTNKNQNTSHKNLETQSFTRHEKKNLRVTWLSLLKRKIVTSVNISFSSAISQV